LFVKENFKKVEEEKNYLNYS